MITFETLREVQHNERSRNQLSKLNTSFYSEVREYWNKKKKVSEDKPNKELQNIKKVIEDIFRKRREKIIIHTVNFFHTNVEPENMLSTEREFFLKVRDLLHEEEKKVFGSIFDEITVLVNKVKFLENTPVFIGADSKKYGPFNIGEEAVLPEKNAQILTKNKIAELILSE